MANPAIHPSARSAAIRFVVMIGILSFFADFTYEGSRSIVGPYLAAFGVSAFVVGVVTGLGELLGYGLRLFSGRWADASGAYWPIIIFGYVVQMASVPALALAGSWQAAAALIILERIGKAIRNPPRDAMLSHAGRQAGGYGFVFGLHEALDQSGALVGPLLVALVVGHQLGFRRAFAVLAIPAVFTLLFVLVARVLYPRPQNLEPTTVREARAPRRTYWVYLMGAALVAAGFADYPLIAFHFSRAGTVPGPFIAVFYSVAMAVSGAGSLVLGRLFDRFGFVVLIVLTAISALFAPLVFLGGFWLALLGAAVWGVGIGVHESVIPAAVSRMTHSGRRASAFGLFTAVYGIAWFVGSVLIGLLYDHSRAGLIVFCVGAELAAIPFFLWVARNQEPSR